MDEEKKLISFLTTYSLDDLAKSFFVLNLWLPNVSSPIKFQYLYSLLETIHKDLQTQNKIKNYEDFFTFSKELLKLVPSFSTLEDYLPETDWGEIKYFLDKRFYRIFYGGDLSNPYDFYYSFELIHSPFEEEYADLLKRSPKTELKFCLELQNDILSNLKQEKSKALEDIMPGHIEIPSSVFWKEAISYIEKFNINDFSPDILKMYSRELTGSIKKLPKMTSFIDNAFRGRNCCYFFIMKDKKIYPVMPRRWLSVLYDVWGNLLKDSYSKLITKLKGKDAGLLIGIKIGHFISDRIDEDNVFPFVAPLKSDLKPPHDLRYTAIHAEDKLYLIYTTPPILDHHKLNKHLDEIIPKLKESAELVRIAPTRLGQFAKQRIVEFRSKKSNALDPVFIIALPSPLTDALGKIRVPDGIQSEIMTLDQLAGIFDEIENPKELNDFFDSLRKENAASRFNPFNSYLDRFGSFKDSSGVLVPGALEPTMIMLDFSWGSNYRFKTLEKFWTMYPEENFFGHPRSWTIPENRATETGLILNSKNFFGYAYIQKISEATLIINAPVHLMGLEEGGATDNLMNMLFDAIDVYKNNLLALSILKSHNKVQFFFCPSSLAATSQELKHLKQLIQDKELWAIDSMRIRQNDFGIRIVYNKDKVVEALKDVKDRSLQITLMIDVLNELNNIYPDANFDKVKAELDKEKTNKPRFGLVSIRKHASFPQYIISSTKPNEREYKLADKEVAKIAHGLDIQPGTYSAKDAQDKLNELREELVKLLDEKIKLFNFKDGIVTLFEKSNALINDDWQTQKRLEATKDHDLDFEISERSSEKEHEFLHWYRVYRYLIEKFVQHQPGGNQELTEEKLKEVLALTDRLMDLYVASDFINYQLYDVDVNIDRDFIVSSKDNNHDITAMDKEFGEEQAKINLGLIGNKEDTVDSSIPIDDYLNSLDKAFKIDFGFSVRDMVNLQQVLALWADHAKVKEETYYTATREEINKVCSTEIKGFDISKIDNILDFLTLKQSELLVIKGDPKVPADLPIWEHNKRLARFDIRPLIKIDNHYFWAPHSIERTSRIWIGISWKHRLPSDFDAPNVNAVLRRGHINLEQNLVKKVHEITRRYTRYSETNIYPHNYDKTIEDIGDCDVLCYLPKQNIILNIESKIIDPPHNNKDSGRMQRRTFVSRGEEDGKRKLSDVERVENREKYLITNGKKIFSKLNWRVSENPKVISLFITKMGFWWLKHPPINTSINFVEIRMLDDFIKKLLS